jgi:hypothetical protein
MTIRSRSSLNRVETIGRTMVGRFAERRLTVIQTATAILSSGSATTVMTIRE